jgi:hypothetical protein
MFCKQIGLRMGEAYVSQLFVVLDRNGDGYVSLEEIHVVDYIKPAFEMHFHRWKGMEWGAIESIRKLGWVE